VRAADVGFATSGAVDRDNLPSHLSLREREAEKEGRSCPRTSVKIRPVYKYQRALPT
jgi:hypothetical protein